MDSMFNFIGGRINGEIIVFNITEDKFRICARISNKPYDSVGCWYVNQMNQIVKKTSNLDIHLLQKWQKLIRMHFVLGTETNIF